MVFTVCLLFIAQAGIAQINEKYIQFDQITNESGRSLEFITGIEQDSTGFLWIATRDGLYRYDGYTFTFFNNNRRSSNQLPFNGVTYIYYDRFKNFWLRNFNNFFLFDGTKLKSDYEIITNQRFSQDTKIIQDIENNYWIGPHNQQIYRFNPYSTQIDTFTCETNTIIPELVDIIKNSKTPAVNISVGANNFNMDTSTVFTNSKGGYYIVATAGEASGNNFFDFAQISSQGKIIWKPDFQKCSFCRKQKLFYSHVDVIYLPPNKYTVNYQSDDANPFNYDDLSDFQKTLYGIKIIPIDNYNSIKDLLSRPYFQPNGIYGKDISDITLNNEGFPLITTESCIMQYDKNENRFKIIELFENMHSQRNAYIPVLQLKDGTLIYASTNEITIKKNNTTKTINLPKGCSVFCIKAVKRHQIWVGTNEGIFIFNPYRDLNLKRHIHIKANNTNRLYSDAVRNIYVDNSNNVWVGTQKGLNRYRQSKFNHFGFDTERFTPKPIISDKSGNTNILSNNGTWLTIQGGAITREVKISDKIFDRTSHIGLSAIDFNDLCKYNNNTVFTTSNIIGIINNEGNIIKKVKAPDLLIKAPNVATKMLVYNNLIWTGLIDRILVLNSNLEIIKEILHPQTIEGRYEITNTFINSLIAYNNYIAVRTEKDIYLINTTDFSTKEIYSIPEFSHGTTSATGNLVVAPDTSLWFTVFPTLFRVSPDLGVSEIEFNLEEDYGNIMLHIVNTTLWLSSNNGLIKIDDYQNLFNTNNQKLTNEQYEIYTTRSGLVDNSITGITNDQSGNLWIATLKGLSFFNTKTDEIYNYFREGDNQTLSFPGTIKEFEINEKIQLVMQTATGLLMFKPDSINQNIPQVVINEILLFGKEFPTDSAIWNKGYLKLKYNENFLTIRFSSLDYTQPALNKYRYRLQNFNNDWTYSDATNRQAPYTGLPPGKYIFTVQGTNNDGIWNETGQTLFIEITPPWWKTLVAYISYVVIIITVIFGYIKRRERKLIAEKRILEIKVKERTIEIQKQKDVIQEQRDHIAEQNKNITDSINYASRIQKALLPSQEMLNDFLPSYFILWRPRDIVSGDFYWAVHENGITIATAADCTGHGVPGAFMSMLGVAFLNEIAIKEKVTNSNDILDELRSHIIKSLKQAGDIGGSKDGMDMSLCVINHNTLKAQWSGANNPLYLIRENEIIEYKADKMPIGYYHFGDAQQFKCHPIDLQIGDRLYMFSDGYVDQFGGEQGRKFMSKNLKQLLIDSNKLNMQEQKELLNTKIEEWMNGREQIDDILVFGIEIV